MITTKKELEYYLKQDAIALRQSNKKHPNFFGDEIWKFQIILRKSEYYSNLYRNSKKCYVFHFVWYKLLLHRYSVKLGFSIPINVFGPGLSIAHYGTIVVNSAAKVGKNCRIQEGVNIGATNGSSAAPQIGNNVFIGTGAKIIGDITIADDVAIGANAVVVKSITENGCTYGGVPAKKISSNNSHSNLCPALFE
ncbi:MAG: serine acetyltransferase [Clostridia bacterium]|nr:serine acetyltransferase [Clostridia bacterium]